MLDNHSTAVKAVHDLIRQNQVKSKNVFYIEKGFEDCFDNETLVKALKGVAQDNGVELHLTAGELNAHRNDKISISRYLNKIFCERTKGQLSKPELGMKIAEIVVANQPREVLTKPECYLKEINEILAKRDMQ